MKKHAHERGADVSCDVCGALHRWVASETQGDGCACYVLERGGLYYVVGAYGSTEYDCEVWRFLGDPPEKYVGKDPVCDACVKRLVDAGLIEKLPDEAWGHDEIWGSVLTRTL